MDQKYTYSIYLGIIVRGLVLHRHRVRTIDLTPTSFIFLGYLGRSSLLERKGFITFALLYAFTSNINLPIVEFT